MGVERGDLLHVTTASGTTVPMRALGAPEQGRDFMVIWVCTEAEWVRASTDGDEPDGLPWPLYAVQELTTA
jgi:hypothetical protein